MSLERKIILVGSLVIFGINIGFGAVESLLCIT